MDAVPPTVEPGATVPPVVAVVVTCDPGWWLEDCLAALAAQDYPELSVLVIDVDSAEDPTPRVAAVLPTTFVRRTRRRRGFAAGANEVLGVVEGASFFVFCHDDVAPGASAVRLLVEEAFRSNAGVVAPKLVGWFAPEHLLAAGMGADTFGVPVALVERGELDQQQHDAVRDVFFAPSPCALVRADLFTTLGGFDTGFGLLGEDLDLGWRAHLAGARVVVAPASRVRHLEATESGQRALHGALRAVGPDAERRARQQGVGVGLGDAVFAEDEDAALAPGSLGAFGSGGGADALARVPDDDLPELSSAAAEAEAPVTEPPAPVEAWDLDRWDQEDADASGRPEVTVAGPSRRRSRRDADLDAPVDSWAGDDGEWEVVPRRRSRRLVAVGGHSAAGAPTEPGGGADGPSGGGGVGAPVPRGPDADALDDLRAEARLRVIASDASVASATVRLPLLLVLTLAEAAVRTVRRGRLSARRTLAPWAGLIRESGHIRRRRGALRKIRTIGDRELVPLQVAGVTRVRQALRTAVVGDRPGQVDPGRRRALAVGLVCVIALGWGSRRLLVGHLPTVGGLAPWPSVSTLLRSAASGWRTTGLGTAAAAPTSFLLLAVAGLVFLGHTTLLQHVAVLGTVPLGVWGAARLAQFLGSSRARLVVVVAYLVNPLPYNAISTGSWVGLVAYGALPWLMGLLLRGARLAPFRPPAAAAAGVAGLKPPRPWLAPGPRLLAIALVTATAGAISPGIIPVVALTGIALALGMTVTGLSRPAGRVATLGVGGAVGAVVLLLPWSLGWLPPSGEWATFAGVTTAGPAAHLSTLLRFQTGTLGAGPIGYALLVTAAFPLVVGRSWRADWAIRLWTVTLVSFAAAWAGQHDALGAGWPPADVLLAPAAIAVALAAGLGMAAFDVDLAGYVFGWRQAASAVAAGALLLACLPVLALSVNGRWRQTSTGFDAALSWMSAKRADGDFRVLWLGGSSVLPLPGWRLDADLAYATSIDGPPDLTDQWPGTSRGATRLLGQAVSLTRLHHTTVLGHLLAPMGVRYVVVVDRPSPLDGTAADTRPVPPALTDGLQSQLDMAVLDTTPAMTVYENDAWAPMRLAVPPTAVKAAQLDDPRAARSVDLSGSPPVLAVTRGPTSFSGTVPAGAVEIAEAPSTHWKLTVAGRSVARSPAWASSNLFMPDTAGEASLHYATPLTWPIALLVQAASWIGVVAVLVRARRRPPRPSTPSDEASATADPPLVEASR